MKKIIFVLSFLIAAVYTANSQILISIIFGDKLNSEKLEFGLTVGTTYSNITNIENSEYTQNFNLGLYFNIRLAPQNWWLHTGVAVKSTYGAKNINVYDLGASDLNMIFQDASVTRDFGIINVPALVRFQTKNGWGLELGPQFSLRTKVDDIFTVDYPDTRNELTYRNDVGDDYKRITVEGAAGFYKKLRKGEGITINFRYVFSLYDILKENPDMEQQHHSVFEILVGIPIGKDKKPKEPKEPLSTED